MRFAISPCVIALPTCACLVLVLRGEDTDDSDLDLLVEPTSETTMMDIARLQLEVARALQVAVDVLTPRALPDKFREQVIRGSAPFMNRLVSAVRKEQIVANARRRPNPVAPPSASARYAGGASLRLPPPDPSAASLHTTQTQTSGNPRR